MRKTGLAVISVVVVGIALFFWWRRSPTKTETPPPTTKTAEAKPSPVRGSEARSRDDAPMQIRFDNDPKGSLQLEGQVVDSDDHPVGGAQVVLSSNPPRTVETEPDGSFTFPGLVGRPYTLVARAKQGVAGPVTAKLTEKSDPVVLQLRPGGRVVVTVNTTDGKPIDGATIELRSIGEQRTTAKAGVATFDGVVPGGYQVAGWADGFARSSTWLQVGAGDTTAKLVLPKGAAVSGHVVDDRGTGVANARVTFHGASDWSQQADLRLDAVTTDKTGAFAFTALPSGSFRFAAAHDDFASGSSELITLDGANKREGVEIKLAAGATVRGRVVDSSKQPLASARVRIGIASRRGMVFEPPRQAYTDGSGAFEIKGLGKRELAAVAIHETGASATAEIDTTAGDVSNLELVVDVTGVIAGVVVDPAGQPMEGVQVSAGPNFRDQGAVQDFSQFRLRGFPSELTDAAGKFTLVGLAKGSYLVNATRSQAASRARRGAGSVVDGVVAETGKKDLRIVLQPEGAVTGRVAFKDGTKPSAITVSVGFSQQSFLGDTFEIDALAPQDYELGVRGPSFKSTVMKVTVAPGKTTDVGTITVAKGRSLAGVVVFDGKPVPNANVYAGRMVFGNGTSASAPMGPMGSNVKSATTDEHGSFSLAGFNDGDLALTAEHPEIGRSKAMRIPTEMSGQTELVLELQKFGSLSGVMRQNGKPIEGVLVGAQSTTTPGAVYGVASGADGKFRYDRLAPDTYKVSATVGMPMVGMKFYSKEVAVPIGKETTVELAVEPGAVTLDVVATPKTGKLGVASVWVMTGIVTAKTANELALRTAALGQSASQWIIIRAGEPAHVTELVPGTYSACVVPFPVEIQGMGAMSYVDRHGDALPAYCAPVRVLPAPQQQTVKVSIEIPALIPDEPAGSGSGSGH